MNLFIRQAIISFCPDLTDSEAVSMPVASVILAETRDSCLAAAACLPAESLSLDKISSAILSDMPDLISQNIDDVFKTARTKPTLDDILYRLHDTLRNSLHVSRVLPSFELAVDNSHLQAKLTDLAVQALANAIADSQKDRDSTTPATENTTTRVWPLRHQLSA